ncbi:magnesium/cobalt transporter CorA [Algoriphagus machipongonensis]|uniref:Magnesium transport protein CorA n=1 Tax=Algoriphagus machipongonensis TaxID=388413 RepID=A3HU75_9BACT|nr:magnesium/cobalt transporter CorA [Algoriphagus machipongonensis]EAZ81697.1 magnesium and cobalt transport protein CorA [Algoriphagus machipongonensis]
MSPKAPNLKTVQRLFKPKKKNRKNIKVGLAPGSLVYTGEKELQQVSINLITYDDNELLEESIQLSQLEKRIKEKKRVLWIDVVGLHDVELLEKIGLLFNIHKLTMEDILNVDQRPKMEAFDEYIFAALKMIQCQSPESPIDDEQISFVLKDGILLTFQEKKGDVFQSVRNRLADQKRAIRQRKADYLLYALLDAVIDNYFVVMENVGERIENLESQAMLEPDNQTLNSLYVQRREMMDLRRTVYPLREVIGSFDKYADDKISAETRPFIRDLYENTIQVIETMEVFRDMSSGVLDLYMNSLSNRMNNIMKVLTIISTIFIPLSFVAGVYGMNFDNMPELHTKNGYFYVLSGMGLAVLGMLYYFKRKNWL